MHVFDPTLDEATAAQVMAIKGITFHPYGLGALDGVVSTYSSGIHLLCHAQKELPDTMLQRVRGAACTWGQDMNAVVMNGNLSGYKC